MFAEWQASTREIGVIYVSKLGTFRALARLTAARNGTVQVVTDSASASFHLQEATFLYGPMRTWPRWPNPPIMEVMALHILLPRGAWLCIAEGLKPEALPARMLPL